MDSETLPQTLGYMGSSGVIFSPEQKAALQTSLCIMKQDYKFTKVYLWGKILGVKDDYFIAQGITTDEISQNKTLYSTDCVSWALLPPATEAGMTQARLAKGRFTGDPSFDFEYTEGKSPQADDGAEEETQTIKEEDRLASVIADIDSHVRIIPRGSFVKSSTGKIYSNRNFEGLSVAEAAKLCSYFHFRPALRLYAKSLLQKANLDSSIDFLDPCDEDIPKGSWSLQFERGSALVILRSLLWIGYTFFHVPGTKIFGSIYVGNGEKNVDLPFML